MGWPTTYNIPISEYRALLKDMLVLACSGNGIVFIEIGGDLLTKAAAVVLEEASRRRASGILCVNDAMGAITGIRLFTEAGIPLRALSTYRQNHEAMADRLGGHPVVNALDPEAMNGIAAVLDEVRVGRANSLPT
jgi:hypothetical protein